MILKFCMLIKQNGGNALIAASYEGRTDIVNILLEAGADKEANDEVFKAFTIIFRRTSFYPAMFTCDLC